MVHSKAICFLNLFFLQSLGTPFTCYVVASPQGELLAGVAVLEDGQLMAKAPFAFTPHQGILFAHSVAQQASQKLLTTEFLNRQ